MMDKPIVWMGRSLKDLRAMPDEVKDEIGYALDKVQKGEAPDSATKMKGDLSDVMEVRIDESGDTYRAMYTIKLEGLVYVLAAFKKKAKRRRETPREDLNRVHERLRLARVHHRSLQED